MASNRVARRSGLMRVLSMPSFFKRRGSARLGAEDRMMITSGSLLARSRIFLAASKPSIPGIMIEKHEGEWRAIVHAFSEHRQGLQSIRGESWLQSPLRKKLRQQVTVDFVIVYDENPFIKYCGVLRRRC